MLKKISKALFLLSLPLITFWGIYEYYESLPIRGAYDTNPIAFPKIERDELKRKLSNFSQKDLFEMYCAGLEAVKWQKLLSKVNSTVITEIVGDLDNFFIYDRYPEDESSDFETKSSYFYHSHRLKEHGHFHIYYGNKEVLKNYTPIATFKKRKNHTHLVSLSMHPSGEPIGFFIPNQWITHDYWYKAEDMKDFLDHFEINHPYPSWPTNQWIKKILVLFRPQIEELLLSRDRVLFESGKPIEKILKNRKQDVLASTPISIQEQMTVLEELLNPALCDKSLN